MNKMYSLTHNLYFSSSQVRLLESFVTRRSNIQFIKLYTKHGGRRTKHISLNDIYKSIEVIENGIKTSPRFRYSKGSIHGVLKELKNFVNEIENKNKLNIKGF